MGVWEAERAAAVLALVTWLPDTIISISPQLPSQDLEVGALKSATTVVLTPGKSTSGPRQSGSLDAELHIYRHTTAWAPSPSNTQLHFICSLHWVLGEISFEGRFKKIFENHCFEPFCSFSRVLGVPRKPTCYGLTWANVCVLN